MRETWVKKGNTKNIIKNAKYFPILAACPCPAHCPLSARPSNILACLWHSIFSLLHCFLHFYFRTANGVVRLPRAPASAVRYWFLMFGFLLFHFVAVRISLRWRMEMAKPGVEYTRLISTIMRRANIYKLFDTHTHDASHMGRSVESRAQCKINRIHSERFRYVNYLLDGKSEPFRSQHNVRVQIDSPCSRLNVICLWRSIEMQFDEKVDDGIDIKDSNLHDVCKWRILR